MLKRFLCVCAIMTLSFISLHACENNSQDTQTENLMLNDDETENHTLFENLLVSNTVMPGAFVCDQSEEKCTKEDLLMQTPKYHHGKEDEHLVRCRNGKCKKHGNFTSDESDVEDNLAACKNCKGKRHHKFASDESDVEDNLFACNKCKGNCKCRKHLQLACNKCKPAELMLACNKCGK